MKQSGPQGSGSCFLSGIFLIALLGWGRYAAGVEMVVLDFL